MGQDLTITIRLSPDGRVFFHDITVALQPIAAALGKSADNAKRTLS